MSSLIFFEYDAAILKFILVTWSDCKFLSHDDYSISYLLRDVVVIDSNGSADSYKLFASVSLQL